MCCVCWKGECGMLNFILCDDDEEFLETMKNNVRRFMMNQNISYNIYSFEGYNEDFERLTYSDIGYKVYLLDIRTKLGSGIDAARNIREKVEDWNSIIILITAFNEYRYQALSNRLLLLDFICKAKDVDQKLQDTLRIVLKHYGNRQKCLSYEYNYMIHRIEFRKIIYIEKEQDTKRSIVYTTYGTFKVPKPIIELETILDKRFLKVHRGFLVNINMVRSYDVKKNVIYFFNGMSINTVARNHKKELMEKCHCC